MENYNRYMSLNDNELAETEACIWAAADANAEMLKVATNDGNLRLAAKVCKTLDYLEGLWNELCEEIDYRISLYES